MKSNYPSNEEMIEILEKKYGESFSYEGPAGGTISSKTKQIYASCPKYPGLLTWEKFDLDSGSFCDNFLSVKYHQDVQKDLEAILYETLGAGAYTMLPAEVMDGVVFDGAPDASYAEFKASRTSFLSLTAVALAGDITNYDSIGEKLRSSVLEHGICLADCHLYFTPDREVYEKLNSSTFQQFVAKGQYQKLYYLSMSGAGEIDEAGWVK